MPKKPVQDKINHSNASTNADRAKPKGFTHLRTKATVKRLKMYNTKPIRNRRGKVLGGSYMSSELPTDTRIRPNAKWFSFTRAVGQDQLTKFREAMAEVKQNPFNVLLKPGRIPMGLLAESKAEPRVKILETESYATTFGPKNQRKRPRLAHVEYSELVSAAETKGDDYDVTKDKNIKVEADMKDERRADVMDKGHSKRIWAELYKVLDSSDVVIQVLDARDPIGTRSAHLEKHIKENARFKHLVLVLNKCDLIPNWATARWVSVLSKEYPTLAFHSSLTHPFGKGALITLLRQFSKLHSDKKQIGIGFVGYPNVGKSSIINTLKSSKVCKAAPIPGETKIWQYIRLTRKINLIDCPGVVPPNEKNDIDVVLRGVVRIENLPDATDFVPAVLQRVKREYVVRQYGLAEWTDHEDFLTKLCEKSGRLGKGGEPDLNAMAKVVLYDWQKGRLPYFVLPPLPSDKEKEEEERRLKAIEEAQAKEKERQEKQKEGEEGDDDDEDAEDDIKLESKELTVSQNFKRINVKHDYTEEDNDEKGEGIVLDEGPDWDELFDMVGDDDDDDDSDDDEEAGEDEEGVKSEGDDDVENGDDDEADVKDEDEEDDGVADDDAVKSEDDDDVVVVPPPKNRPAVKKEKKQKKVASSVQDDDESTPTTTPTRTKKNKQTNNSNSNSKNNSNNGSVKRKRVELIEKVKPAVSFDDEEASTPNNKRGRKQKGGKNKKSRDVDFEAAEEDDGGKRQKKSPRQALKKKKAGVHFYETANVKNRNRNKKPQ